MVSRCEIGTPVHCVLLWRSSQNNKELCVLFLNNLVQNGEVMEHNCILDVFTNTDVDFRSRKIECSTMILLGWTLE